MQRDANGRFVEGHYKDYTGIKKNRLTFISFDHIHYTPKGKKIPYWLCKCDCGNTIIVSSKDVVGGHTKSCGCFQKEQASKAQKVHGESNTRLYYIWENMRKRCYNKRSTKYKDYGARGIIVCDEWKDDYQAFSIWAKENGYKDSLTIDRIDVNGNYEPSNCRWATPEQQADNKRNNHKIEINGEIFTPKQLSEMYSIPIKTIYQRIYRGDTDERIVRPLAKR